jgi:hypothetical protein
VTGVLSRILTQAEPERRQPGQRGRGDQEQHRLHPGVRRTAEQLVLVDAAVAVHQHTCQQEERAFGAGDRPDRRLGVPGRGSPARVQAAVEGYVYRGEVTVYGALDSVNYPDSTSFLRHQYPSQLPERTVQRMYDAAKAVMRQIGFDNGTFSIGFFYDLQSGQVSLLEINPRHSQSHAELFGYVDGVANHEIMVRLGLGEDPGRRPRKGDYEIAAKWYLRRFEDGLATRVPTCDEVAAVQERIDGTVVEIVPKAGQRLSELPEQDSYSFELAQLFIAAGSEREMEQK